MERDGLHRGGGFVGVVAARGWVQRERAEGDSRASTAEDALGAPGDANAHRHDHPIRAHDWQRVTVLHLLLHHLWYLRPQHLHGHPTEQVLHGGGWENLRGSDGFHRRRLRVDVP